jgi:hypothetical protein
MNFESIKITADGIKTPVGIYRGGSLLYLGLEFTPTNFGTCLIYCLSAWVCPRWFTAEETALQD